MWARVVEFMLACWLALSPFIFHHPSEAKFLWTNDFVCAALIAFFSLLSACDRLRKLHFLNLGVGLWLWMLGYRTFPEMVAPPAQENSVIIGLLILMLALIPTHSHLPSRSWAKFFGKNNR